MAQDGQIDAGTLLLVLVIVLVVVTRSLLASPATPLLCLSLCAHPFNMPGCSRACIIPPG